MKRWSLEVTFEEGRAHPGIETQRQWSDRAIERATSLLFGLYSLVAFFGQALRPDGRIPVAQTAWYRGSSSQGYWWRNRPLHQAASFMKRAK